MAKVLKPFTTTSRRFAVNADVSRDDVAPLDFDHLVDRKFIEGDAPKKKSETSGGKPAGKFSQTEG